MGVQPASCRLPKGSLKVWVQDIGLAASLFFKKGPEKIKPLASLADSMLIRATYNGSIAAKEKENAIAIAREAGFWLASQEHGRFLRHKRYSGWSYSIASMARMKIAEIHASQGKYADAIEQCKLASGIAKESKKSQEYSLAMMGYYEGKRHWQLGQIFPSAINKMTDACQSLLKIGRVDSALEIGNEVAELFISSGKTEIGALNYEVLANQAMQYNRLEAAATFFSLASKHISNRAESASFRECAAECRRIALGIPPDTDSKNLPTEPSHA